MSSEGDYSAVADGQLDDLEQSSDVNAVLDVIELILRAPGQAQFYSTAITTAEGIRMRLPVPGFGDYKVFWSTDGPRIEAIFKHP
ncbi:hypothetical protein JF737_20230 [Mycobacterium avium]|uniref:hypothetical protein n=1 Tax=Mycobacterium avium TaxID=1764 RepID=UPI001CDA1AAC|nr:hypothetical protein [Mycobacterium avium]MCA2240019.1 hypothetical protein [Mycobacterium avium]MCA2259892.1 hypothetical protein [Mycobacterium avium]MCA2271186.1 hypothetical protein [Mycobacterium avium]MCA2281182.1 hypothetical protein [Mycobacterium avium]MCA2286152.1 hypothetical protein [Mycobacterium avium]